MNLRSHPFLSGDAPASADKNLHSLSALSREVDLGNALGLRNMPWKPATDSAVSPRVISVDWLIQQRDLPFLVQALPAQLLHRSLMAHGMDDSLEIIEWIRGKQLVRFMDYEMWEYDSDSSVEDVSGSCLVQWFRRWLEIGPQFAAERLSDFEEESLVLILTKLLDIQVEGLSRFDVEAHDDYWTAIDGRFHLRVKDGNPESFEVIKQVIDALYGVDIKWAGSVLSHAAMLVRSESLENATKWREGRMADAGFVPADEARSILRPRKTETLRVEISKAVALESAKRAYRERVNTKNSDDEFDANDVLDEEALADLTADIGALLGSMEPELAIHAIEDSVGSEGLLRITEGAQFAPEYFVEDEALMEEAIAGIVAKTKTLLLRLDAAGQREFRSHRLLVEKVFAHISEENPAECVNLKARLARVSNMFLSGSSTSKDADSQERALAVVRGSLNLGLEFVLSCPRDFGFSAVFSDENGSSENIVNGSRIVELVGPEFLFQLGWSLLSDVANSCAVAFEDALATSAAKDVLDLLRGKSKLSVLVQEQHFAGARSWLSEIESRISAPVFHVVATLVNRVPLYPEVLSERAHVTTASATRRAFESMRDVDNAKEFVANLSRMDVMG